MRAVQQYLLLFIISFSVNLQLCSLDASTPDAKHSINLKKPSSIDATQIQPYTLYEFKNSSGESEEFYMDVDSGSCFDNKCKIATIRLFWDAFGNYKKYSLNDNNELTKFNHTPFTNRDYRKLQSILSDHDSPLKNVKPSEIIIPSKNSKKVDGITGATAKTLKKIVVPGAVYTSYNLWHWAHGSIKKEIQTIAAKSIAEKTITSYLNGYDSDLRIFALQALELRSDYSRAHLKKIYTLMKKGNARFIREALSYLRNTPKDKDTIYYSTVTNLFKDARRSQRTVYLESLLEDKTAGPDSFYNQLLGNASSLESYLEVNLMLNLIEKYAPDSSDRATQTIKLLKHDNNKAAKRAHTSLLKIKLTPQQQAIVNAFATEH